MPKLARMLCAGAIATGAIVCGAHAYVTRPATIVTIAGQQGVVCSAAPCGDGGSALEAFFYAPDSVASLPNGDVVVSDSGDDVLRKIDASTGAITTIAGTFGKTCSAAACGDGGPATAALLGPQGIATDAAGDIYIADHNDTEVRRIDHAAGIITTVAGMQGVECSAAPCGDGGPATSAKLDHPTGIAVDAAGNLYIADTGDYSLREVDHATQTITRLAGSERTQCPAAPCGDGGAAGNATLSFPVGVKVDGAGDVYVADAFAHAVRRIDAVTHIIATVAGTNGSSCPQTTGCGDGGAATSARLFSPSDIAFDAAGNLLIADTGDQQVRVVLGPQGGPAGAQGAKGDAGTNGANGATGATGPAGPAGKLVLVAYQARVAKSKVTVRFVLTGAATVRLAVTPRGKKAVSVASAGDKGGVGTISWNRKLRGKAAARGRYRLTVSAVTPDHQTTSSTLSVTL